MKAPRDLVFQGAVDARFDATIHVIRAVRELEAIKATGIPARISGATRRLDTAMENERKAKAALNEMFAEAARESA